MIYDILFLTVEILILIVISKFIKSKIRWESYIVAGIYIQAPVFTTMSLQMLMYKSIGGVKVNKTYSF